jgi:hypothetical protein
MREIRLDGDGVLNVLHLQVVCLNNPSHSTQHRHRQHFFCRTRAGTTRKYNLYTGNLQTPTTWAVQPSLSPSHKPTSPIQTHTNLDHALDNPLPISQ